METEIKNEPIKRICCTYCGTKEDLEFDENGKLKGRDWGCCCVSDAQRLEDERVKVEIAESQLAYWMKRAEDAEKRESKLRKKDAEKRESKLRTKVADLETQACSDMDCTLNQMLSKDQQERWGLDKQDHERNIQLMFMRACQAIDDLEKHFTVSEDKESENVMRVQWDIIRHDDAIIPYEETIKITEMVIAFMEEKEYCVGGWSGRKNEDRLTALEMEVELLKAERDGKL